MRKVCAAPVVVAFALFSTTAAAQDSLRNENTELITSQAARLSDAELDEVTAGAVLSVIILPPSDASQFHQGDKVTVLILGTGKGNDIFGSIVLVTDRGAKIITIPGGH